MVKLYKGIESQPSQVVLNQIVVNKDTLDVSKSTLNKVVASIQETGFNLSFPFVCITDEEDKYQLLTGLAIYEAAIIAGIERIWVFLIAAKQPEAEKYIEQALLQGKLNDRVIEPEDVANFLEFINNKKSDLTKIPGVKDGYAKLISDKRPYASQEDMQKKLGAKRSLNWLKAYKTIKH